jgi:hypothetical protein
MSLIREFVQSQPKKPKGKQGRQLVNINTRLDASHVEQLDRLADTTGYSRSGLAERLLALAIDDACTMELSDTEVLRLMGVNNGVDTDAR